MSDVVWEGRIGSIPLRVEVVHAEKISAEWEIKGSRRNQVSKSVDEFEKAVLFQVLLAAGEKDTDAVKAVREAVIIATAEKPAPVRQDPPKRKRSTPRRHRRSRTPPRR